MRAPICPEPEVNFLDNVYLYNIDDLQAIADDYLQQRREEIAVCEKIIREKAKGLLSAPPGAGAPGRARLAFGLVDLIRKPGMQKKIMPSDAVPAFLRSL